MQTQILDLLFPLPFHSPRCAPLTTQLATQVVVIAFAMPLAEPRQAPTMLSLRSSLHPPRVIPLCFVGRPSPILDKIFMPAALGTRIEEGCPTKE